MAAGRSVLNLERDIDSNLPPIDTAAFAEIRSDVGDVEPRMTPDLARRRGKRGFDRRLN